MFRQAVTWKTILNQPASWYKTPEAQKIAQNVLLYQHTNGGWEKNLDMLRPPKTPPKETTIDNGATTTQLTFFARVGTPECQASVLKAIDYLLSAHSIPTVGGHSSGLSKKATTPISHLTTMPWLAC